MERIYTLLELKTLARNAAKDKKKKYLDHAIVATDKGGFALAVMRVYVYVAGKVESFDIDAFSE
jgi:hypothetical protein